MAKIITTMIALTISTIAWPFWATAQIIPNSIFGAPAGARLSSTIPNTVTRPGALATPGSSGLTAGAPASSGLSFGTAGNSGLTFGDPGSSGLVSGRAGTLGAITNPGLGINTPRTFGTVPAPGLDTGTFTGNIGTPTGRIGASPVGIGTPTGNIGRLDAQPGGASNLGGTGTLSVPGTRSSRPALPGTIGSTVPGVNSPPSITGIPAAGLNTGTRSSLRAPAPSRPGIRSRSVPAVPATPRSGIAGPSILNTTPRASGLGIGTSIGPNTPRTPGIGAGRTRVPGTPASGRLRAR